MSKLFINCKQATYLHEQNREGKLGTTERFGLWLHLLYCGICRLFVKQVDEVEKACGKMADAENVQMPEEAKQKLASELQKQMK